MTVAELLALLAVFYVLEAVVVVGDDELVLAAPWGGELRPVERGVRIPAPMPWSRLVRLSWSDGAAPATAAPEPLGPALAVLSTVLWLLVFVAVPASVGGDAAWLPSIGAVLALVVAVHVTTIGVSLWWLRHTGLAWGPALRTVGPMVLVPTESMHALARIESVLHRGVEPYATARALMSPAAFVAFAHREGRRLETAAGPAGRSERLARLAADARRARAADPIARDPSATHVCPVCGAGYRASARCADCDVPLEPVA
jgi:hypothetical protein